MSTRTERSEWSPEEVDSLENIDKEIQLVSTSSESCSTSNHTKEKGSVNNTKVISDFNVRTDKLPGQSKNGTYLKKESNVSQGSNLKQFSSCDDLSLLPRNKIELEQHSSQNDTNINRSTSSVNFKLNKKITPNKYDHVESKVKHYFSSNTSKPEVLLQKPKNSVISEGKESSEKEEYLEEINKQLTKELDEKNAILSLLQENYEHLLFKYAEAQNRIDELRFKFLTESESKNCPYDKKYNRVDNQLFSHFHCNNEYLSKAPEIKYQKPVIVPFIKSDEPFNNTPDDGADAPVNRPSTLPLDKFHERDLIKATTPTDSEGLSSIITSMSGHSKILNSLDEENQMNKKSSVLKFQPSNFILEETPAVNDPFDKVKNWQNSLPPLEQIETPETTLYNVFANNADVYSPAETKYKDISSPKPDKDYNFLDESCPTSWRDEQHAKYSRNSSNRSEEIGKVFIRASSLPNTLKKHNPMSKIYNKNAHHSIEVCAPSNGQFQDPRSTFALVEDPPPVKNDIPTGFIIQKHKKRPPLLRCSSLPAYDNESLNSANYKNGIYIPPLNLGNITLSDDESSCQNNYYLNKSNAVTSSSFLTSRGTSIDRSIQTPQSFSSCKATISEENSFSRVPRPTVSKSTSITPDRSRAMDLFFASKYDRSKDAARRKTANSCIKECSECCSDKSKNWCNVCGESISEGRSEQFFRNRSNSCESMGNSKTSSKEESIRRQKPPFTRSISFNSETNTPKYITRDEELSGNFFSGASQESLENFDVYARNLQARSQVVMKALTAHVNNS